MITGDGAKAFAAIFAGIIAIASAEAGANGYLWPALIAGGLLIIAGIGLATEPKGNRNAN